MGRHGGGSRGGGSHHSSSHHHFGGGHHHYGGHHHHGGGVVFFSSSSGKCSAPCFLTLVGVGIFLLAVILALSLAPWSKTNTLQLGTFESRPVPLSTTWYQGVTVTTTSQVPIISYKMAAYPPFSDEKIYKNETQQEDISRGEWASEAYYLLQGSSVAISFNFTQRVTFFVLIGQGNYESWQESKGTIYYQTSGYSLSNYNFVMPYKGDDVYFVWENGNFGPASGIATLTIGLVTYNLTGAVETCSQTVCPFTFSRGSSEVVIVSAGMGSGPNDAVGVTFTSSGRSSYYWAILGGVIAASFAAGAVIVVFALIMSRRSSYSSF